MAGFLSSIADWFRSLWRPKISVGHAPDKDLLKQIAAPLFNTLMRGGAMSTPMDSSTLSAMKPFVDGFAGLIREQGREASEETLANARSLGLDVDALLAEHEILAAERARQQALSWKLELSIDLTTCDPASPQLAAWLSAAGVPDRPVKTQGASLRAALGDYPCEVALPEQTLPIADVMALAIKAAYDKRIASAEDFPPNQHPFRLQDVRLTLFGWDEPTRLWYLEGEWQPSVHERTPSHRCPERSIDLCRVPPSPKPLIAATEIPRLEQVTLGVCRWPSGRHEVQSAHENADAAPPPHPAADPELPAQLRLTWPAADHPRLHWTSGFFDYCSPAVRFVQRQLSLQAGKPADWLDRYSSEAVFVQYHRSLPATDLRASLISGPAGPAPLPEGVAWPACPCCGDPALFSQSVDMRDVAFAGLLPGTTLVVFACNDCLDAGEWSTCPMIVWLPRDQPVVLVDRGDPKPLLQASQWYGPDFFAAWDLPEEVRETLAALNEVPASEAVLGQSNAPSFQPCYGTKAGGVPSYLQADPTFYDRTGCKMEYIAQLQTPEHISAGGFGYVFHSNTTGETYVEFQDT